MMTQPQRNEVGTRDASGSCDDCTPTTIHGHVREEWKRAHDDVTRLCGVRGVRRVSDVTLGLRWGLVGRREGRERGGGRLLGR